MKKLIVICSFLVCATMAYAHTEEECGCNKPKPTPTPTVEAGYKCDKNLNPVDGASRNITYNPVNQKNKPKLIMTSVYNTGVSKVSLYQGSKVVAKVDRMLPNEHGDRPRWYANIAINKTPKDVVFVFEMEDGKKHCVAIKDPSKRYD